MAYDSPSQGLFYTGKAMLIWKKSGDVWCLPWESKKGPLPWGDSNSTQGDSRDLKQQKSKVSETWKNWWKDPSMFSWAWNQWIKKHTKCAKILNCIVWASLSCDEFKACSRSSGNVFLWRRGRENNSISFWTLWKSVCYRNTISEGLYLINKLNAVIQVWFNVFSSKNLHDVLNSMLL